MANVAGLNLCAQLSTASIPDYRGTPVTFLFVGVAGYKKSPGRPRLRYQHGL